MFSKLSFHWILRITVLLFCLLENSGEASPAINLEKLYDLRRLRRDEAITTQPEDDVLELQQFKNKNNGNVANNYDDELNRQTQEASIPNLEKQLEDSLANERSGSPINLGQPEEEELTVVQHNTHHSSTTTLSPRNQEYQHEPIPPSIEKTPPVKPFYGAARLAFGQNPEIITTSSTTAPTTTTTTIVATTTTTNPLNAANNTPLLIDSTESASSSVAATLNSNNKNGGEKTGDAGDTLVSELEATKNVGERRSVEMMPPKIAQNFLTQKDGQYSPFDMAQYIFWTGDEAGVARVVEELIQQGLMSRENAIIFLRDIRMGIEFLQKSHSNRIFPSHLKPYSSYKNDPDSTRPPLIFPSGEAAFISPTVKSSMNNAESFNANLQKALEGIPALLKLQESNNAHSRGIDNSYDYDDTAGRTRVADFLYAEYSLEEVIYQLAKVMFSQSLTQGSEQSQKALQKLTAFLESEGEHGRISPSLQKKILDVLLAALSDTLSEHPQILAAARTELGSSFHKLPKDILNSLRD